MQAGARDGVQEASGTGPGIGAILLPGCWVPASAQIEAPCPAQPMTISAMRRESYIAELERDNAALRERVRELEQRIAELEQGLQQRDAQMEELRRQLGKNSQNSSKPPSSDPPQAASASKGASVKRRRKRKRRGARKQRTTPFRQPLPEEYVDQRIEWIPKECDCGSTDLKRTGQKLEPHQCVEIPQIQPTVTQHEQPIFECQGCGRHVYEPLPDPVKRRHFGPNLLALVGILTGVLNLSKRKALAAIQEVFSIRMSLGGLSKCEAQLTQILEEPCQEAAEHVRSQETAHADETHWRMGNGQRGWLWTLCSTTAAIFMVHLRRSREAAAELLKDFAGVLVTDRYGAYGMFKGTRQFCWAHLKRDFKAIGEYLGRMGEIGQELHTLSKTILGLRKRVRKRRLSWATFQKRMEPLIERVEALLDEGACLEGKASGKCRCILKGREHLWTFVRDPAVEPTNNRAERAVRQGVMWRKLSIGTKSERGARYVERVLTVCATCHAQGRSAIAYLREACNADFSGKEPPSLLPATQDEVQTA